jgi:trehalose 6-phosphate phosphatase
VALLAADPAGTALLCDFDGTLSDIVAVPEEARPVERAAAALTALAPRLGRVAVISGRPVSFLEPLFPAAVTLVGLYGLERRVAGRRRDHADAERWRPVVADVVTALTHRLPAGAQVEDKGLSLTVHYRGAPERESQVADLVTEQSRRSGLDVRPAKMSFELHPPIDLDKGTTVAELARGLRVVAYIGDDVGDLPAFDALDRLADAGTATVAIAVAGAEPVAALVERADCVLDDPTGAADLLDRLLTAVRPPS